jgi:uncharacterized membrane protein
MQHMRVFVFRGLLAVIPLLLCGFALKLLYNLIDKQVVGFLGRFMEVRQIPGLGILIVILCLYFIGLTVSNFLGRKVFRLIEKITERIPFIKTIYGVGKQLSQGLSMADGKSQAFKKAVLVKLGPDGLMVPAFVMNSMKSSRTDEEFLFVLIPTAPTPASGFVCVLKASQVFDPGWTVEECLKTILSVGIVAPPDKGFNF